MDRAVPPVAMDPVDHYDIQCRFDRLVIRIWREGNERCDLPLLARSSCLLAPFPLIQLVSP